MKLSAQLIAIIGIVALVALVVFAGPAACNKIRSLRAQSKVTQSQGAAFQNSAGDAINTTQSVGSNQSASEDLTRSNSEKIHAAEGANQAVNPAAQSAGIKALCGRKAYANAPSCRHP